MISHCLPASRCIKGTSGPSWQLVISFSHHGLLVSPPAFLLKGSRAGGFGLFVTLAIVIVSAASWMKNQQVRSVRTSSDSPYTRCERCQDAQCGALLRSVWRSDGVSDFQLWSSGGGDTLVPDCSTISPSPATSIVCQSHLVVYLFAKESDPPIKFHFEGKTGNYLTSEAVDCPEVTQKLRAMPHGGAAPPITSMASSAPKAGFRNAVCAARLVAVRSLSLRHRAQSKFQYTLESIYG
ncbi:uncharacterized protein LOC108919089 isoform X2 [Scleropages formosus]|uniref:uncharacterized protein LOC108919089 isoform X2 n=1 Tax=Scleropages formosus TaxID=113540 RepID=UPI0010FA9114|nr:uncharacterized protein LOC108919089 isoform X2 [Scleropages formosus]